MHVKRFSSLRLSPVGFTLVLGQVRNDHFDLLFAVPFGDGRELDLGIGRLLLPAQSPCPRSCSTSRAGRVRASPGRRACGRADWAAPLSIVSGSSIRRPCVMRPGLPTDVSMWQPASSNFCGERLQEPSNESDGIRHVGQVDPHKQSAAVAGIVFDDGVGRASFVDQELLDRLDLLERRFVFGVRGADFAALRVVPLGIAVNEDERQPHDVGIRTCLPLSGAMPAGIGH